MRERAGGVHPWFLEEQERRFEGHSLVREQRWTDGNQVDPLVHGHTYFARLAAELEGPSLSTGS